MSSVVNPIQQAADRIRKTYHDVPAWGIVLGSGLGGLADEIEVAAEFAYADLPHFPTSTAAGHAGRLVFGELAGVPVVAMKGRFHLYEGWSAQQAVLPIRVMHALGARRLLLSNAAGGVNPEYRVGDVMAIDDHINFMFRNPLVGPNDDALGPRFPDMSAPYCPELIETAEAAARNAGFKLHRGVYAGMLGPTYETRAEYRMLRRLGADAAGMSTVPEAIAAVHLGMPVAGFSAITNECSPDVLGETTHEEVQAAADSAAGKLLTITRALLASVD
ncbi:MAG: purine-nucleoside phosphorylase [Planctomycetota bacterium]